MKRKTREAGENAYAAVDEARGILYEWQAPPKVLMALNRAAVYIRAINREATRAAKRRAA